MSARIVFLFWVNPWAMIVSLILMMCVEPGADFALGYRTSTLSLWSKIRCPAEANPAWRW
jgi:nucleolar pre-ribosomal-associated protein 1